MNTITYAALAVGVFCLLVGVISIFYATRFNHNKIVVSWLLLGSGTAFLTFALFPGSSADGTVLGFKIGGALAALMVVWMFGMRKAREAVKPDELNEQLRLRDAEIQRLKDAARRPKKLAQCKKHMYTVNNRKKIGLITGDIKDVKGVDVWVSSENTNMEMARFFDRSVSAAIRYYGSTRDAAGDVTEDLIADELKRKKGNKFFVQPTSVYVTGPGELKNSGVSQIFHVAAVHGTKPDGYAPVEDLEGCVRNALAEAEAFKDGYKSILFPLLATGTARGDLKPISRRLIQTAVSYLEDNPDRAIETVYFLTWSDIDLETCQEILNELGGRVNPV